MGEVMSGRVVGKFVSKKINKVRWKPGRNDGLKCSSEAFVTGSWDDTQNTVCSYKQQIADKNTEPSEPVLTSTYHFGEADVTDLQFGNLNFLVCGSSDGSVTLLKHENDRFHRFKCYGCSCTGVCAADDEVATVGEDGRLIITKYHSNSPHVSIDEADCCSLTAIISVYSSNYLVGNMQGQIKLWDVRADETKPTKCLNTADQCRVTCLTQHPSQLHIVASGGGDGKVCIWDLRGGNQEVSVLNAHTDAVSEIQFHSLHPNHLFSCSQDNSLWHWNANTQKPNALMSMQPKPGS